MTKLDIVSERVTTLEKLVIQLAKWINFDLQNFANETVNEEDIKLLRQPETRSNSSPSSTRRPTRSSGTGAVNQTKKSTARKVTSVSKQKQSKTLNRVQAPSKLVTCAVSSGSSTLNKKSFLPPSVKKDDDNLPPDIEIKQEPIEIDEGQGQGQLDANAGSSLDDFILGGPLSPEGHLDNDFEINPEISASEDENEEDQDFEMETDNDDEDDEDFEPTAKRGRKRIFAHAGKPRYRNFAPLHLPESESAEDGKNPKIKMDKLSKEELTKMNVSIPGPRTKYQRGPHPCPHPECDEIFARRDDLRVHKKVHQLNPRVNQKFVDRTCPQCPNQVFQSRYHLTLHLRIHAGERPFVCSHCGYATRSAELLKSHINTRHPETPREKTFMCDKCPKSFFRERELVKHTKKEHGENGKNELQTECPICKVIISDNSLLGRHMKNVHENERRNHVCELCGQRFKRPEHLRSHIARHDNPNRRKRGEQKPLLKPRRVWRHPKSDYAETPPVPVSVSESPQVPECSIVDRGIVDLSTSSNPILAPAFGFDGDLQRYYHQSMQNQPWT